MITEGMMQAVFEWIRNLTGFFLFMSVMDHLMPEKAYASYIKFFSGMVFILLVLQPITGNQRLEERIAQYYESNLFRYETGELKQNLLGIEEKRRSQIASQYETALGQEIARMAQVDGFEVNSCQVKINQDTDSEQFGEVTGVRVEVCSVLPAQSVESSRTGTGQNGSSSKTAERLKGTSESTKKESATGETEIQISKIIIENQNENPNKTQGQSKNTIQGETQTETQAEEDTARAVSSPVYQKMGELRSRISWYCGVEEQNVEIGVVEAER